MTEAHGFNRKAKSRIRRLCVIKTISLIVIVRRLHESLLPGDLWNARSNAQGSTRHPLGGVLFDKSTQRSENPALNIKAIVLAASIK